ncbi:MAG: class I SAM-dependent methyltransferase [Bryobacteraceae bacterium]
MTHWFEPTEPSAAPDRKDRESQFHDTAFSTDLRKNESKYYSVVQASFKSYEEVLTSDCEGKAVLEYGCGPGSYAFVLQRCGARVVGIDLSQAAIEQARKRAAYDSEAPEFFIMDAERLEFEDGSFDMICGRAILHHLDLKASLQQITRVLRSDGRAVFLEPLGHNPIINWYRKRTPSVRTVDEHPLLMNEVRAIMRSFTESRIVYFHCLSLATVPFRNLPGYSWLLRVFDSLDRFIFAVCPPARRLAWTVMLELKGPKRDLAA